jgi:RNA polymerase sigma-70 factor, ECF subfamily
MNTHQPEHLDAEAIWRDLHGPLLGFIARRVPDRASAEDILQDVMLRILRHVGELKSAPALGGWIHEVARNAIIDHYRRAVVRRERPTDSESDLDRPAPAVPEPGPAELRTELAACLDPLLTKLPAIYRDALRLTDLDGLTQADAAALIGLSTSGMKTRVQRGRAQLKALFARCCEIELDRRGGVIDYQPNNDRCDCPTSTSARPAAKSPQAPQPTDPTAPPAACNCASRPARGP